MCRRCCCHDLYYDNDDSSILQYHIPIGSIIPKIKYKLASEYHGVAVDYHNKRVLFCRISGGTARFFITPTMQLRDAVFISNAQGFADTNTQSRSLACDWNNGRFFYAGLQAGLVTYDIHKCNYNGTADTVIATQAADGTSKVFRLRTTQYDPASDRIFYVVDRYDTPISPTFKIAELLSVKSDGSNQTTVVELGRQAVTGSGPYISTVGNFVALPLNASIACLFYSGSSTPFASKLRKVDLSSGAITDLISTTSRNLFSPQYCYHDGKIYFISVGRAAITQYKQATYNRINADGSNEEVIMSWADPAGVNTFSWGSGSTSTDFSFARLGCDFESSGSLYNGVG